MDRAVTSSVEIGKGYATANKAVLLIAGDASSGKIAGEVLLLREGAAWRVDDELMELDSR